MGFRKTIIAVAFCAAGLAAQCAPPASHGRDCCGRVGVRVCLAGVAMECVHTRKANCRRVFPRAHARGRARAHVCMHVDMCVRVYS